MSSIKQIINCINNIRLLRAQRILYTTRNSVKFFRATVKGFKLVQFFWITRLKPHSHQNVCHSTPMISSQLIGRIEYIRVYITRFFYFDPCEYIYCCIQVTSLFKQISFRVKTALSKIITRAFYGFQAIGQLRMKMINPYMRRSVTGAFLAQVRKFTTSSTVYNIYHRSLTNNGDVDESIFFGVNSINRLSFLRSNGDFISQIAQFPGTKLIFFNQSQPLCRYLKYETLVNLLRVPVLDVSDACKEYLARWSKANSARSKDLLKYPTITFLGMDRKNQGVEFNNLIKVEKENDADGFTYDPSKDQSLFTYKDHYVGVPYLAIDITDCAFFKDQELPLLFPEVSGDGSLKILNLHSPSPLLSTFFQHLNWLDKSEALVFSQGKMFLDWIRKNKYCSACGLPNLTINAGSQLLCTSTPEQNCIVRNTPSSNVSHPRTDLAVISSVANDTNDKLLLVNNKKMPVENLYTCVAGFMDPGEAIETCVTREIWEETNVITQQVQMVLSQPWPYPGTLMVGCCGITEFNNHNEIIHLGHDNELRDARWFDFDYIREIIIENEKRDAVIAQALAQGNTEEALKLRNEEATSDILLPVKNTVALELVKQIVF